MVLGPVQPWSGGGQLGQHNGPETEHRSRGAGTAAEVAVTGPGPAGRTRAQATQGPAAASCATLPFAPICVRASSPFSAIRITRTVKVFTPGRKYESGTNVENQDLPPVPVVLVTAAIRPLTAIASFITWPPGAPVTVPVTRDGAMSDRGSNLTVDGCPTRA